jgi:hypothetical protein
VITATRPLTSKRLDALIESVAILKIESNSNLSRGFSINN